MAQKNSALTVQAPRRGCMRQVPSPCYSRGKAPLNQGGDGSSECWLPNHQSAAAEELSESWRAAVAWFSWLEDGGWQEDRASSGK